MPRESHDQLIEHILRLEKSQELLTERLRTSEHLLRRAKVHESLLGLQSKAMQTLSLGIFGPLEAEQIYALVCESLVVQLGWDAAIVVHLHGTRATAVASFGATQQQLAHVHDYAGQDRSFIEAYSRRQLLTTLQSADSAAALGLRSLFATDDVVAVPVQSGESLYSYLIACSHGTREHLRGEDDIQFLAAMGAQIGNAVQNSRSFRTLEAQNLRLRQIDELKDSFISITSHQLRTPLSIIKWILSILQTDPMLAGFDRQRQLIDQAYESNERLIHVVNDLLNASRIQDGHLPLTLQPTSLAVMVQDICSAAERVCAGKGLRLESDLAADLLPIEVDPILFKESLQNLVDNAIDYNQEGGEIKVRLYVDEANEYIEIANTGFGITPEDQRKVFQQFFRSGDAVRVQPNGNGLGLYLTRAIIREHGGDVTCESADGRTVFTVQVPLPKPSL